MKSKEHRGIKMPSHYANQFKYEFYLKDNWCFAIMLWLCWIKLQCTCITFVVLFWRVIGMNVESLFCRKCKLCSSYVPGQGLTHIPFLTSWNYVNVCVFSKQIFSYRISISWYVKVDTSRLSKLQNSICNSWSILILWLLKLISIIFLEWT